MTRSPRRPARPAARSASAGAPPPAHYMSLQDPRGIRRPAGSAAPQEGHVPVLADEVLAILAPAPGSLHIDATVGGGGHTERILEASSPDGRLLGLDADGA